MKTIKSRRIVILMMAVLTFILPLFNTLQVDAVSFNENALLYSSVTPINQINKHDYYQYAKLSQDLLEFKPSYTMTIQTKDVNKALDDLLSVLKTSSRGTNYIKRINAVKTGNKLTVNIKYRGNKQQYQHAQAYVDNLLASLPKDWALEDRIAYIAISISHLPYHWNINETVNKNGYSTQIADSLITGGGQCAAYSEMFNMAMNRLGVENRIVYGIARSGNMGEFPHAWSMIKVNGQWYHVDPTFIRCQLLLKDIGWLDSKPVFINWDYFMFNDQFAVNNGRRWNTNFYPKTPDIQYLINGKKPEDRYQRRFKKVFSENASIISINEGKFPKVVNDNFFK